MDLIGRVGMEEWVSEHWSKNTPFSQASLARAPEILDEYRAMLLANEPHAYIRTCQAIARTESLTAQLDAVSQPALVIAGSDDDRTLPEAGGELASSLANASFVELAGVGHTMPLEAPGEVGGAIREFLASTDGAVRNAVAEADATDGTTNRERKGVRSEWLRVNRFVDQARARGGRRWTERMTW